MRPYRNWLKKVSNVVQKHNNEIKLCVQLQIRSTTPAPAYYTASAASTSTTSSELPSPRRLMAPSERVRRNLQRLRYIRYKSHPRPYFSTKSPFSNVSPGPHPHPHSHRYEDNDMRQINALNKRLESLTIADMSPRLTLQARHNSVINYA